MTTTIESAFGSRVLASGFLLNNELTDLSFRPRDRDGRQAHDDPRQDPSSRQHPRDRRKETDR